MTQELTHTGEVLPAALKPSEAQKLEKQAQQHYSRAQIGVVLFAADLARLQEGDVHRLRGFSRFGEYVERTFEGIKSGNALQIVRQGQVLLRLERTGRIKLEESEKNLPGTTALRELSAVSKRFGDDAMLQAFDIAAKSGRKIVGDTVIAALGTFIQIPGPERPELDAPALSEEEEDEPYGEYDEDMSDKEKELIDRIRDLSYELPHSLEELSQTVKTLEREQKNESTAEDQKWMESSR